MVSGICVMFIFVSVCCFNTNLFISIGFNLGGFSLVIMVDLCFLYQLGKCLFNFTCQEIDNSCSIQILWFIVILTCHVGFLHWYWFQAEENSYYIDILIEWCYKKWVQYLYNTCYLCSLSLTLICSTWAICF